MLLLAHAAATLFMVGLIWFVQIVHYPLFAHVGLDQAVAYAALHQRWTTWVVGPPMLLELATVVGLVLTPPDGLHPGWVWLGAALLGIVWAATAFLSVPAHEQLASGWDAEAGHRLVVTNWVRTLAWTGRGALALFFLGHALGLRS